MHHVGLQEQERTSWVRAETEVRTQLEATKVGYAVHLTVVAKLYTRLHTRNAVHTHSHTHTHTCTHNDVLLY